ncbi:sperm acrosome-associated protein 5-like [Mastacembelus armatus]|uniref:sperm acrosome-associated protein 5-like n=1 Tax=Mastacembelus armatus TaxID=205130 RepID=UPI000E45809B|nr:sperm acrosome-associated protein 5-like [Mastacembelus armatus]
MKLLVVFLLVVLGCSLAEGRTMTKCDLRAQLLNAMNKLPNDEIPTENEFLAKVVCHAELSSGFTTSAVNHLKPGTEDNHFMERQDILNSGNLQSVQNPEWHPDPAAQEGEVLVLSGIFQLSNNLVCNNGSNTSPNICETECTKLQDDDITDDISCLFEVYSNPEEGLAADVLRRKIRQIRLIFQEECKSKTASEYFSDCA